MGSSYWFILLNRYLWQNHSCSLHFPCEIVLVLHCVCVLPANNVYLLSPLISKAGLVLFQMPTSCLHASRCLLRLLPFPSIHHCIIYNQRRDACADLLDLISSTHCAQSYREKNNHCSHCRLPQIFSGSPHRSYEVLPLLSTSRRQSHTHTTHTHTDQDLLIYHLAARRQWGLDD